MKIMENVNVNVREIRRRLKHGDLKIIAKRCGTDPRMVAEVLNKGRDSAGRYDEIVSCALDLLKGESEAKKSIVAKAKEQGFATDYFARSDYRKRKRVGIQRKPGGVWKVVKSPFVLVAVIVVAAWFLVGKKLFAGSNVNPLSPR